MKRQCKYYNSFLILLIFIHLNLFSYFCILITILGKRLHDSIYVHNGLDKLALYQPCLVLYFPDWILKDVIMSKH